MCLIAYTPAAYNAAAISAERAGSQPSLFGAAELLRTPVHRSVPMRLAPLFETDTEGTIHLPLQRTGDIETFAQIEDEIPERWDGMS